MALGLLTSFSLLSLSFLVCEMGFYPQGRLCQNFPGICLRERMRKGFGIDKGVLSPSFVCLPDSASLPRQPPARNPSLSTSCPSVLPRPSTIRAATRDGSSFSTCPVGKRAQEVLGLPSLSPSSLRPGISGP